MARAQHAVERAAAVDQLVADLGLDDPVDEGIEDGIRNAGEIEAAVHLRRLRCPR